MKPRTTCHLCGTVLVLRGYLLECPTCGQSYAGPPLDRSKPKEVPDAPTT
jgi:uncharacterized Zn finger protein (UPF0148 family)